jgi:hypothetical protein
MGGACKAEFRAVISISIRDCVTDCVILIDGFKAKVSGYFNNLKPSGNYMYHLILQSVSLHFAHYGFHIILRINIDYFPKQHQPIIDLFNGDKFCFL